MLGSLTWRHFWKTATFTAFDLSEFFSAQDTYYRNGFYGCVLGFVLLFSSFNHAVN
jgi:hypothetical protein